MPSSLLSIGQTGLTAAQVGISTAGHNIANASTPGYSRQSIVQTTLTPQYEGFGFVGKGTQVAAVQRTYSDFLGAQVNTAQAAQSNLSTYGTEISQIDNLFGDTAASLTPALQDFFTGLGTLNTDPSSTAARGNVLSNAQALAARFNSISNRLTEIDQGLNAQISGSVGNINSYAKQIATLNDTIAQTENGTGQAPNDLLDQRDLLVNSLSKEVKVSLVKQDNGQYNVFIGNGLPLVVGGLSYGLTTVPSLTDATRIQPAYTSSGSSVPLSNTSVDGGTLGALLNFRTDTLDAAQNALGRVAIGLSESFNAQNKLGQDANGALGGNFFNSIAPQVTSSRLNSGSGVLGASISNANALTTSDYRLQYNGTSYTLTRLSDKNVTSFASFPQTVDGVQISLASGTVNAGDEFLIRPTAVGASGFGVAISDASKIAVAAPVRTAKTAANTGTGTITAGTVSAGYPATPLSSPVTLTYNSGPNTLTGFPGTQPVTVTAGGISTTYAAGVPVPYTAESTISFGGISFSIAGAPADTDTFTIAPNTSASGDSRNGILLAALQTQNTLGGGKTTYQGAYADLVAQVGNKAQEIQTTGAAADQLLADATKSQQSVSGVNLDEEAADLLRYQQAYQASGKMIQIAQTLFDVLLNLGN